MQIKHFKKNLIMNNKWIKTCKALKGLLDILSCSKCKKSLHDPQQFLTCGHFSCLSCINNKDSTCIQCQLSCGSDNIIQDETIEKIVQACCIIAQEVGLRKNIENIETTSNDLPLVEQTDNTNNISINNSNFHIVNPQPDLNNLEKEPLKKLKKRRSSTHFSCKKDLKKVKLSKPISNLRIPKKLEKKNHHGETLLQEKCKKGDIEYVRELLKAGANSNTQDNAGWTPLQECADFGYYEIAELLLSNGGAVNQPGCDKKTPLHEAAKNNNYRIIELLLRHGAIKDVVDDAGKKPIDYCESEKLKKLLDIGVQSEVTCTKTDNSNGNPNTSKDTSSNSSVKQSKRAHRKSVPQKRMEKKVSFDLETEIKPDTRLIDSDDELEVVFEKISSSKTTNSDSKESILSIPYEKMDIDNTETKDEKETVFSNKLGVRNNNCISINGHIDDIKSIDDINGHIDDIKSNIDSQESIDVLNTSSQNSAVNGVAESEEFIDVIN